MVSEATEDVGEPADNLEPDVYDELGDIDDEGDPGEPGLKGPELVLMERTFSCLGLRGFEELEEAVVPMLDEGDCGEFGLERVSTPEDVETAEELLLVPFAVVAAAASSSSSGISLACPLMWASISFLLLKVSSQMVHL